MDSSGPTFGTKPPHGSSRRTVREPTPPGRDLEVPLPIQRRHPGLGRLRRLLGRDTSVAFVTLSLTAVTKWTHTGTQLARSATDT